MSRVLFFVSARVMRRVGTDPAGYFYTGYPEPTFRDYYDEAGLSSAGIFGRLLGSAQYE